MSFWSREAVSKNLKRLALAIKSAAGSGLARQDAQFIRKLADVVRILERRDSCRVAPEFESYASQSGASGWELYLDCTATSVEAYVFDNQVLAGEGRMIMGSHKAIWSSLTGQEPEPTALESLCEVLETQGPWRMTIWLSKYELALKRKQDAMLSESD